MSYENFTMGLLQFISSVQPTGNQKPYLLSWLRKTNSSVHVSKVQALLTEGLVFALNHEERKDINVLISK